MFHKYLKDLELNDFCFFALVAATLVYIKVTNIEMSWAVLSLLAIFVAVYQQSKLKYLIGTIVFLVFVLLVQNNIVAYNYYFSVLMVVIGLSALSSLVKKTLSYLL